MQLYLAKNVLEAARERVSTLFDLFPNVVVAISGGKDSTIVYHLAMEEAVRRGRLPLPVFWLDQEAEWQHVVDYNRKLMSDPRVRPLWYQGPFTLPNCAADSTNPFLQCWAPGVKWMRDKEPNSIHDNPTKKMDFYDMFPALIRHFFGDAPVAMLGGVRCDESPNRYVGLTTNPTYQWITWGKQLTKAHHQYTFYPIYDWHTSDVWKAIHEFKWPYCPLYDLMWQYGYEVTQMRVSNVNHETAIAHLEFMQEIEPGTWAKITERCAGVNSVKHVRSLYQPPGELPFMFDTWRQYRDYLLDMLIEPATREKFCSQFASLDERFAVYLPEVELSLMKCEVAALLVNDHGGTKLASWQNTHVRHERPSFRKGRKPDKFRELAGTASLATTKRRSTVLESSDNV